MSPAHRRRSLSRFSRFQRLEDRRLLTASMGVYAWELINQMRANPSGFADELEAMVNGTGPLANATSGHGYDQTDPLWDDIRRSISFSSFPEHFDEALALLRSRDPLGPLGWEDSLHTRSSDHNDWMENHCFAHSQYGVNGSSSCGAFLPGFTQPGINGNPDIVTAAVLGPWSNGAWGENIGYGVGNSAFNSLSEFGADSDAYLQRLSYHITLGFIIEVNSTSLGHLENLLRSDQDGSGQMNVIGIHIDVYPQSGSPTTSFLVTHTLSNRPRTEGNEDGAYVTGVAYQDGNSNGYFDIGEQLDVTEVGGVPQSNTNGRVSLYVPEGSQELTVFAGNDLLFDGTLDVGNSNVAIPFSATSTDSQDTIGLFQVDASIFHLKESLGSGESDYLFQFGGANSGWTPLVGDWDGDGQDSIGLYQSNPSLFHLKNDHVGGASDIYFAFGPSGTDWVPLVGDWDGDGIDTVGFYQPDTSVFHLKNSFAPGDSDIYFQFGGPGSGWQPVVGDWDGNGTDTIGFYQGDASLFHLKNDFTGGPSDVYFQFGPTGDAGWMPLAGDWNGDSIDTVGLYQPDGSFFHLKDSFAPGDSNYYFGFGPAGAGWLPLTGAWSEGESAAPSSGGGGSSGARIAGARLAPGSGAPGGEGLFASDDDDRTDAVDAAIIRIF
ncbi:MAG: hypothetical protein AAF802_11620 [Planctomycetota bacterium]